jgi:P-type conjugative transfer protein TrbL
VDFTLLDEIPLQIQQVANTIEAPLAHFALQWLTLLLTIQLAWGICDLLLRQASAIDAGMWFLRQIIQASFFVGVINFWTLVSTWVIGTFRDTANSAAGFHVQLTPSAVVGTGVNLAADLLATASLWDVNGLIVTVLALLIVFCFIVIAILMVKVIAEAFLVTAGAVAFLGFAGSGWTMSVALSQFRYVLSVAAKLFVLVYLSGIFNQLAIGWVDTFQGGAATIKEVLATLALSVLGAAMILELPQIAQSIVHGQSFGFGGSMVAATAFSMAGMGALTNAIKSGIVGGIGGGKLLSASKEAAIASGSGAGSSGIKRAAAITAGTLRQAGSQIATSSAARLSGTGARHGSLLWNASWHTQKQNQENAISAQRTRDKTTQAGLDRRSDVAEQSRRSVAAHVRSIGQEKREEAQKSRTLQRGCGAGNRFVESEQRRQENKAAQDRRSTSSRMLRGEYDRQRSWSSVDE